MIFKVRLLLSAAVFLSGLTLRAQDLEIGVTGGLTGYMGDYTPFGKLSSLLSIGDKTGKGIGFSNWNAGAFARMEFNQKSTSFLARNAGVRFNFNYTSLEGADQHGSRWFSTRIREAALLYELNIRRKPRGEIRNFWNPYVFAGVGLAFYNAENHTGGKDVNSSSFSVPAGAGIKYTPAGPWNFALEIAGRMLSDDIDGGLRVNNAVFDTYKALSFRVSYTIPGRYL